MEQVKTGLGSSSTVTKVAISLVAGLITVVLLLPWSGNDSDPPQCFSMFDYSVPCGAGLAFGFGVAVGGVAGIAFWLSSRRR